ncbi:MAG: class I SAM-dependent methyltransferase [Myxococcota bacterium]
MSTVGAALFQWVQAAPFYEALHRDAVSKLEVGGGRRWLDVGCGPGLVARLAAAHGYDALGVDRDPDMIAAARGSATARCRFEVGALADEGPSACVVSAASLLYVLADPLDGMRHLWRRVHPGGALLVVETTDALTPARATGVSPHPALLLWATTRRGRAVDRGLARAVDATTVETHPLLDGLVEAWVLRKGDR